MPSKKSLDGEYRDVAHPINSAARDAIQKAILEGYEKALSEPEEIWAKEGKKVPWKNMVRSSFSFTKILVQIICGYKNKNKKIM